MNAPILALRDVHLADGPWPLFTGVDLALGRRDRACVVGRNGAGKSTLLRMLAGLVVADDGDRFAQPGIEVSLVAQEPTIEGESLAAFAMAGGAPRHRAEAALEGFGLDLNRSAANLSGGEARRAALGRAFAEAPDVLLLDEPTNHLDIIAIEHLEDLVARSPAAVLIVSHDRAFLERTTGRCFWLEDRRVRRLDRGFGAFEAWAEALVEAEAETARRLDKAVAREQRWMERGVTARRARNEGRRRRLVALRQARAERRLLAPAALSPGAASAAELSGRRVIEATRISKTLGGRRLASGFSARILRGDRVAVIGPNGAGKTTLVRMLLGEAPPDSGEVVLGTGLLVAHLDQARADLATDATLADILAPGGGDQIMVRGAPRAVAAYARQFLFGEHQLRQPVSSLSGGERGRLALAKVLATGANLLALDEPTNDLDMETLDLLTEVLADFDGTLILVSHDRDFIERLATSTIALDGRGRVVETPGGWSDFMNQNPGFFEAAPVPAPPARTGKSSRLSGPATKLSFRDERRLALLEAGLSELPKLIAATERTLADPGLYVRDVAAFDAATRRLAQARAELAQTEAEWLELEERRDSLARPAAVAPPGLRR